jgi:hypothetical protein
VTAFVYEGESGDGKRVFVRGPGDLLLEIDHDDVDREQVDGDVKRMVILLNEHWPE